MKIIIEFGDMEKYDDSGRLIFDKSWTTEGNIILSPRMIWLMNSVQELSKEYKRRNEASKEMKNPLER